MHFVSKTPITVVAAALCSFAWCQQPTSDWQLAVRQYAEAKDWNAAMVIVDSERDRAPQDIEVLMWRARLLLWSGRLQEAEHEWRAVVSAIPTDPDNWMGLASVYWRQGHPEQALQALNAAVKLDSHRADIHLARARALQALHDRTVAKQEYRKALDSKPSNAEAKAGLLSLRTTPKNQLLVGTNTDLFSFEGAYQQNEVTLLSQWTSHWKTGVTGDFYQRGGVKAGKAGAMVTASSSGLGALTIGGTAAHDNGIIPRNEFLFEFDHGLTISDNRRLRAIELVYGQHWYWYSITHIMTINETTSFYFPGDWTWSLRLIGSRSQFNSTGSEWSPAGTTGLGFPIISGERHRLAGNVFFAVGTENFSQVDQIGSSSSRTYGGGIRLQLTPLQDLTGYGAYQMRSQDRSQTSFGATYGLRF
jgi:tetratricopeptide (TPR) repeat protein